MSMLDPRADEETTPVPPLTLRDAQRIAHRLAAALDAHNAWVRRLHTRLICHVAPAERSTVAATAGPPGDATGVGAPSSAENNDDIGRWFEDETAEYIRRHPEYRAASEHHRELRARADALRQASNARRAITPEDYEAFASAIARFDQSMEALVGELWDLLRYTDPLTGIATRHAMLPRLKEERNRSRRTGHRCSICMVDLDLFKEINDTYGHQAGDTVLEAVSAYFTENLRRYDQVCRYGGEEFVLMLPDTDPPSALPVVERLRAGLEYLPIITRDGRRLRVTASFGIAPLAADCSVRTSIDRADQAMYDAKRAGRNKVCVWRPRVGASSDRR